MLNSYGIAAAKEMGAKRVCLSVEDTFPNVQNLIEKSSVPVALILYEDVPLFTSAVCIRSNPCSQCLKGEKWMSLQRDGRLYNVLSRNCQTYVFDNKPFVFNDAYLNLKPDFYQVDFIYKKYDCDEALLIWKNLRCGKSVLSDMHGNLQRGQI